MANFERGAYEPRGGDNIPIFDGAVDEDDQDEGSRLPLLIVIALLVLAAFAGVVWLAYTQGVQRGRADAPRTIAAASGPEKVAPANPGGTATPYTGLKIYQQPAPADDGDTETAPPPTPVPAQTQPPAAPAAPAPDLRSVASAAPETRTSVPPVARPAAGVAAPSPQSATHAPTKLGGTVPSMAAAAPPEETQSAASPPPPVAKARPAPPASAAPSGSATAGGAYVLQIGAYKSEDEANTSWRDFKARHAMAGAYASRVKKVDLGDKGVWYRLQLASFPDKGAAADFCEKLKADGGNCFVAK